MTAKQVLVIDDEDGIREIIQFSLEAVAGWDVTTAASGSEGIAKAATNPPDIILLDVMMPGLDGEATFQQLQANPETCNIPVIMLTAKALESENQQLMALGVAGVITKPFKAKDLVMRIQQILNWEH
jgi:CheY-like chemotaxis protein